MNNLQSIIGAYFIELYLDKKGHIEYMDTDCFLYDRNDIDENDYKHAKALKIN